MNTAIAIDRAHTIATLSPVSSRPSGDPNGSAAQLTRYVASPAPRSVLRLNVAPFRGLGEGPQWQSIFKFRTSALATAALNTVSRITAAAEAIGIATRHPSPM